MSQPVAIVITDQNGNYYSIQNTSTGSHVAGPVPVVLCDQNGNALVFSSTIAFPNGSTATTQSTGDSSTKIATDAFVANTFAAPPALGSTTPAAATVTTLTATGAISKVNNVSTAGSLGVSAIVYQSVSTGNSSVSGSYSTVYTTIAAGLYRIVGCIFATTQSSSSWAVELDIQVSQNGQAQSGNTYKYASCTVGTTASGQGNSTPNGQLFYLANGATIGVATNTSSGSNTGGAFTYAVVIERLA